MFDGGHGFMAVAFDNDKVAGMDNDEAAATQQGQGGGCRHNNQIEVTVVAEGTTAAIGVVAAVVAAVMNESVDDISDVNKNTFS
jgi:hypothetical protein